jgi:hypothetical protein
MPWSLLCGQIDPGIIKTVGCGTSDVMTLFNLATAMLSYVTFPPTGIHYPHNCELSLARAVEIPNRLFNWDY